MNHPRSIGIDAIVARVFGRFFGMGRHGIAAVFAGSALLMTSAAMAAIDLPPAPSLSSGGPSSPGGGMREQLVDRSATVLRFYCNEHSESCTISLECATRDGQNSYEGSFAPMLPKTARTVSSDEIEEAISWDRQAGITCRVLSQQDATVHQLRRYADGRLVVTSGSVQSEDAETLDISGVEIGRYKSILVHSIRSPQETAADEASEITVFCRAPRGETCGCNTTDDPSCEAKDLIRLSCSEDDGTVHEGVIGWMRRHAMIYLDEDNIATIIGHQWEGRGLSCDFRSDHPVSVEMTDYFEGGDMVVKQSATMPPIPVDDASVSAHATGDPLSLPVRAYAYAIPSSESRDQADMLMYCNDEHHHCPAWLECTAQSGEVLGDRGISEDPRLNRRADVVIPPRGTLRMNASEIAETITKGSWAGTGRLSCAIRSDKDVRAQVWMHSGDHPPANNTYYVRSEEAQKAYGGATYQVARLHSIPAAGGLDTSNIRIHCTADEPCNGMRIRCSEDDGTMHEAPLSSLDARSILHIKTDELAELIDYRWQGIALACEVQSYQSFNLQLLTRTGDQRVLLDGAVAVHADQSSR